jgi:hypothetical protein
MRSYHTLRRTGLVASPLRARQGLLGASGLTCHRRGSNNSFSTTSALAFLPDRANTIGFIGLGAMGNHMVNYYEHDPCRSFSNLI